MELIKLYVVHTPDSTAIVLAKSAMLAAKQIKDYYKADKCNYRVEEIKSDKPQIVHIEEF